jgi:UDP-glucose 4-epimerase
MRKRSILVTGGAGFIGSHLVDAFIEAGHDVVVLDDLSTGFLANVNPRSTFVEGDITDGKLVGELFARYKFDIVDHHAAQLDVRKSVSDPIFDARTNILGTITLLEAARNAGTLDRFIFASTGGAVYGEQEYFPADEQHPTAPISPYGIAKRSIELYLNYYRLVHQLPYIAFRYTNVYGPRQNAHGEAGVVAIFIERLLHAQACTIYGTGEQTRDYVFVGDLVTAHLLALDSTIEGSRIYNISTAQETDVNEIFHLLSARLTTGSAKPVYAAVKLGEQLRSVCSYDLIANELGWSPSVLLREGLAKTADSFKSGH